MAENPSPAGGESLPPSPAEAKPVEASPAVPSSARASTGSEPATTRLPARSMARELGVLGAIGVLAAAVITVCVNILAARFYARWDVTSAGLYTLSPPTLETLRGLADPVELVVLLSRSDPHYAGVARLLDQYRAESGLIEVRHVDPDRNPAEFMALQNRYRLGEGRAEGGRVVSDAALVIVRGSARWVIGAEDITEYDEVRGVVHPRLEQAITEGLRQVLDPTVIEACFVTGQGEPSIDDAGPTGLGALQYTLRRNNYETRELDLAAASSELVAARCDLLVLAAPRDRLSPGAAERLVALARQGKALLIGIGAALDEESRPLESGLEPLLDLFQVRTRPGLVFERDPDAVLPVGLGGEAFLAMPKAHAITQGLLEGGEERYRVLVQLAQAVEQRSGTPSGDAPPPSAVQVTPLLGTSERAFAVLNAARLAEGGVDVDRLPHDAEGPFTLALAAELARPSKERSGGRLVLIGSASPLLGATWQDATLTGTRRFVEAAVSWLVSQPSLVSLPDKPGRQVELRFTEESLGQVVRYVLVYMPGTALALGGLILYRRRSARAGRARPRDGAPGGAS